MPKKYKMGFINSVTYEKMYKAYLNARKAKRYRRDVILFNLRYEERLSIICKKIKSGKYEFGKFKEFYVYDPKKRRILAAPFEDRVVHTWYVKEFIEKIFVPSFIPTSYACIKGKGMHRAALAVQQGMIKCKKEYGEYYILKMDIAKYFSSINKEKLYQIIQRKIKDKDVLWILKEIIYSKREEQGIPIRKFN